jgi:CubicO group peptidase (beta-lactamase class C family)
VTKSVISTLVGIALTRGDLRSLDQTLGELLPQHRTAMSTSSAGTTIRQLLTMTGGWTAFYDADTATPELVRRVLNAGPEVDPGTFVYSNVGPHLLSACAGPSRRHVDARRILDADYITQAPTNQVPELEGKIRGYGCLWWVTPLATHGAYSARGRYGQLITVVPDLQAVIVISSRTLDAAPSIEDHLAMMDAAIVPGLS